MTNTDGQVTQLLKEWGAGSPQALGQLMPQVYDHVRDLAARALAHEPDAHTLQPTALVNEAYLRLAGRRSVRWKNREQFFGFLADLMRRILVDHARRQRAGKRGGDAARVGLGEIDVPALRSPDLLALDDALRGLEAIDLRQCRIVELKFFVGLQDRETAEVLSISVKTVERQWRAAKAWLHRELTRSGSRAAAPD
ncbi:MAG: sigma-70 family RNA polymerase sigma factor [bacterium]|nr:sigma-70 family RNA polymerase sigma factor [bacterium]